MENTELNNCYNNHLAIDNGISKEEMLSRMTGSRIVLIRTHGTTTAIETSTDSISTLTMTSVSSNAFYITDLIVYGACLTGQGRETGTNLVNSTCFAGVNTVIGFEKVVNSSEMNDWCLGFFESLSNGNTIINACTDADDYVESNWHSTNPYSSITTDSWYIAGSSNTVFS